MRGSQRSQLCDRGASPTWASRALRLESPSWADMCWAEPIDNSRHLDEKTKLDAIKAERLAVEAAAKAAAAANEPGAGGSSSSGLRR